MKKIIYRVQPGVLMQKVFVTDSDNNDIKQVLLPFDEIPIFLADGEEKEIFLKGNYDYLNYIELKVEELEKTKFGHSKLTFHYSEV